MNWQAAPAEPEITASPEAVAVPDLATFMASASQKQSAPRAEASRPPPPAVANGMAASAAAWHGTPLAPAGSQPPVGKSAELTQQVPGTRRMTTAAEVTMAREVDKKKKISMFSFGSGKETGAGETEKLHGKASGKSLKKKKSFLAKLFS